MKWFAAVLVIWFAPVALTAAPITVLCSVNVPVVDRGQTAQASALVHDPPAGAPQYQWKASGGQLGQPGQTVEWNPGDAAPGPYTLTVIVTAADGSTGSCSVVVFAGKETRSASNGAEKTLQGLRTATLLSGKKEGENYGLYSYLVLGSKVTETNRERYKTFLRAFLETVPAYDELRDQTVRAQFNMVYVPLTKELSQPLDEQLVLDHYDFGRARVILERVREAATGDGPYLIASDRPLGEPGPRPARVFFEDLSTFPVSIVKFAVDQFRAQTAQERWDRATLSGVALRLRYGIELAAGAYPEVLNSIKSLGK